MRESRGQTELLTFGRLVALPENRFALDACRRTATGVVAGHSQCWTNPLFLHGQPGTGKTHLVWAIVHEVCRSAPRCSAVVLAAGDCASRGYASEEIDEKELAPFSAESDTDLLIVEDLQQLPRRVADGLARVLDERLAHDQQTILTATMAPSQLPGASGRLLSRIVGGLVVSLEPLAAASRLTVLRDQVQRRHLVVAPDVLTWLAETLTSSGRALTSTLDRLAALSRSQPQPLDLESVAAYFCDQAETGRLTIDQIARHVGSHFQVDTTDLRSQRRHSSVRLPRQVGMYLARRLTSLSLEKIGAYFGGRDHSTVLHACRKIEEALRHDPVLGGRVRQLQGDLA